MRSFRQYQEAHRFGGFTDLTGMSHDDFLELVDYMAFSADKILSVDVSLFDDIQYEVHLRSGLYLLTSEQLNLLQRYLGSTKWLYNDMCSHMAIEVWSALVRLF